MDAQVFSLLQQVVNELQSVKAAVEQVGQKIDDRAYEQTQVLEQIQKQTEHGD